MSDVVTAPTQVITANVDDELRFSFSPPLLQLPNTGAAAPTAYFVQLNLETTLPESRLDAAVSQTTNPVHIGSTHLDDKSMLFAFTNVGVTSTHTVHYSITIKVGDATIESPDPEMTIPPPNG